MTPPPIVGRVRLEQSAKERLLHATDRLCADISAALLSHHDLPSLKDEQGGPVSRAQAMTPSIAFKVGTDTSCTKSATGEGQITVGVPTANAAVPLAPIVVTHLTPGTLQATTHQAAPADRVPPGVGEVKVSLSLTLPIGVYIGHLRDEAGAIDRPFVIYLDGLP